MKNIGKMLEVITIIAVIVFGMVGCNGNVNEDEDIKTVQQVVSNYNGAYLVGQTFDASVLDVTISYSDGTYGKTTDYTLKVRKSDQTFEQAVPFANNGVFTADMIGEIIFDIYVDGGMGSTHNKSSVFPVPDYIDTWLSTSPSFSVDISETEIKFKYPETGNTTSDFTFTITDWPDMNDMYLEYETYDYPSTYWYIFTPVTGTISTNTKYPDNDSDYDVDKDTAVLTLVYKKHDYYVSGSWRETIYIKELGGVPGYSSSGGGGFDLAWPLWNGNIVAQN